MWVVEEHLLSQTQKIILTNFITTLGSLKVTVFSELMFSLWKKQVNTAVCSKSPTKFDSLPIHHSAVKHEFRAICHLHACRHLVFITSMLHGNLPAD